MNKKKVLSFVLASTLFGLGINSINAGAIDSNIVSVEPEVCDYKDIENHEGYESVDILGKKYNFSEINPAVLQSVARCFDEINSQDLSDDEVNKIYSDIKSILDDYLKDPKKYENFPVTLDLGPSSLFREEILFVQNKISELKSEQETIKNTKLHQQAIDEKVSELQSKIDKLINWINYSVVHFSSSEYKETFCDRLLGIEEKELITLIYSDLDYNNVFKLVVNSDGSLEVDSNDISVQALSDIVKSGLEYENLKVRNLQNEIEKVKQSKISEVDQKARISELNNQIESVKAYSLAEEIVLLNMEIDAIKSSRASVEFINQRVSELTNEINQKLESIKNHINNDDYVITDFEVGKTPVYFGYVLDNNNGFSFKLNLDADNKIVVENVIGESKEFTNDEKTVLKDILTNKISESNLEIEALNLKKHEIENKDIENKYYLIDAIDKAISVLSNDINNYNIMISQL